MYVHMYVKLLTNRIISKQKPILAVTPNRYESLSILK